MFVDKNIHPAVSWRPELLGGINLITAGAVSLRQKGETTVADSVTVQAIPYYAWSHRGPGQMEVWIPFEEKSTRPEPEPTLASMAKIEASLPRPSVKGINDRLLPEDSKDESNLFYHWWPEENKTEWIVYRFEKPVTLSSSSVYWFRDYPDGGCDLPASWSLQYLKRDKWISVKNHSPYPVVADDFCKVGFDPVTTSALKLIVRLPEKNASGIHEWTVE